MFALGRKWFDCAQCHQEQEDHQLLQTFDLVCEHRPCSHLTAYPYVDDRRLLAKSAKNAFEKMFKSLKIGKSGLAAMNTTLSLSW